MAATVIPRPSRLAVVAVLCALASPAWAAESIVLMPLELSSGLEGSRTDLESAVAKGLAVAGRMVVPPGDPGARGTYVARQRHLEFGGDGTAEFVITLLS